MKKLTLNKDKRIKLLEMCDDLFSEHENIMINEIGDMIFSADSKDEFRIHWLQVCMFNLPKRISENNPSRMDNEYDIYESMSKRILGIHKLYVDLEIIHPVDFLYEEFMKI